MSDLVPYVGKLWRGTDDEHRGTAWLLSSNLALTAAHCVGSRKTQKLDSEPLRLEFPQAGKTVSVTVIGQNFLLDAALLQLAEPVADLQGLPLASLPAPQNFPAGLRWHAYGFPSGNPSGMALDGTVTLPNGSFENQPVIQLVCNQGGVSELDGESGGPICVDKQIVGLIRSGSHADKVIYATSLVDLAKHFPEVKQRLQPLLPFRYTPLQVLTALTTVTPTTFRQVIFELGVNRAELPGQNSTQKDQGMALIEKLTAEKADAGLAEIVKVLERNPDLVQLMKRVRENP